MRVFISWSGDPSHRVALALREWLPSVLQHVDPWVSSEDIDKGARWITELGGQLKSSSFGIICLVPGNVREPWINFEAGAMSREIDADRVAPFLVGLGRSDVRGPLAQFQSTVFEKEDVRKLVQSINRASDRSLTGDRLGGAFELSWPRLSDTIERLDIRGLAKRDPLETTTTADNLHEKQVEILVCLGRSPDALPTADMIARAISENVTTTRYHLDRLQARDLVGYQLTLGGPTTYYLATAGRAYVVERDLL